MYFLFIQPFTRSRTKFSGGSGHLSSHGSIRYVKICLRGTTAGVDKARGQNASCGC
ncbi:hypothetical protein L21SP2_2785 [Salinispira pacifica]|uniref:Uncharacterized protein n=1 Tax=Salinispira pacifica TaxID=1307761 RepID=V5WKG6_9SPIO|nr:hypothetical protein L21SP2_2785 [Salinispira pacifica]